jgi:hypothetical protein
LRFSGWGEAHGLAELARVEPHHIAAYIEIVGGPGPQGAGLSKPSVKQIQSRSHPLE